MAVSNDPGEPARSAASELGHYCLLKPVRRILIHLSLAANKRDNGKQCRPRSDAAERGVWSGSTLFALNSGISMNHGNNKN